MMVLKCLASMAVVLSFWCEIRFTRYSTGCPAAEMRNICPRRIFGIRKINYVRRSDLLLDAGYERVIMKIKSSRTVMLIVIGIILVIVQQPCYATIKMRKLAKEHEQVIEKAEMRTGMKFRVPDKTRLVSREPAGTTEMTDLEKMEIEYQETVGELMDLFNQSKEDNEKVTILNYATSSGFVASIIGLAGLLRRSSITKLDKKLRKLEIAEKRYQLEQDGINPEKYF
jgi:hypothetical protein